MIGEFARSVWKHSNTLRLLRYNSHICYVSKINALIKTYRGPSCDQCIKRAYNLEEQLTTGKERVNHVFPQMCISCEKRFLTNWTRSISLLQEHGNIWSWNKLCAERKTPRYRYYNMDWQTRSKICTNFVPFDWTTIVFMQFQSRSFSWVICSSSWWVSNTEPSATEIKVFGHWDYCEEKTQTSFFLS